MEFIACLERLDRVLRLFPEIAGGVRGPHIVQLCELLLYLLDVAARVAELHNVGLRVVRKDRVLRRRSELSVHDEAVDRLELFDGRGGGLGILAGRVALIVAEFLQPLLHGLDGIVLVADAEAFAHRILGKECFDRLIADLAVVGQLVRFLEFLYGFIGLFTERAGHIGFACDVAQLIQALLDGLDVLALVAALHNIDLCIVGNKKRICRQSAHAVAVQAVVRLERFD